MEQATYSEEEFKKVLKRLFAEKKALNDGGLPKKFQNKLADLHATSLKRVLAEREAECADLRGRLERVRPALIKLVETLKADENAKREAELERLADGLSQIQRQAEIIKELREENASLKRSTVESPLREECEEKERIIERAYAKLRESSARYGEVIEEVGALSRQLDEEKAAHCRTQQDLAKKGKEATLLRDHNMRQREQLADLQQTLKEHKDELQLVAKELQEKRNALNELQEVCKHYDQMAATVTHLKAILGKSEQED